MRFMKIIRLKSVVCALFVVVLFFSGCIEEISNTASDIGDKAKNLLEEGTNSLSSTFDKADIDLINGVSSFPIMGNNTIDTFESYQNFADHVNLLFRFLNKEGGYDFQVLKGTREEYEKISKVITEYSPLIDNYNEVIYAAREYNDNKPGSSMEFYKAVGIFGLELTIIYTTVWYGPAYKGVGMVYRWSGLNRLAFKYPTLVSFILSKAHWGLRGITVDKSSEVAEYFIDEMGKINN